MEAFLFLIMGLLFMIAAGRSIQSTPIKTDEIVIERMNSDDVVEWDEDENENDCGKDEDDSSSEYSDDTSSGSDESEDVYAMSTIKGAEFINSPLKDMMDMDCVPGIGKKTKRRLKRQGFHTTLDLVAKYVDCVRRFGDGVADDKFVEETKICFANSDLRIEFMNAIEAKWANISMN